MASNNVNTQLGAGGTGTGSGTGGTGGGTGGTGGGGFGGGPKGGSTTTELALDAGQLQIPKGTGGNVNPQPVGPKTILTPGTYEFVIRTLDQTDGITYHRFRIIVKETRDKVNWVKGDIKDKGPTLDGIKDIFKKPLLDSTVERNRYKGL